MKITHVDTAAAALDADAVVVGIHAKATFTGPAADVDTATGGTLARLMEHQEITGKKLELVPLLAPVGMAARQVLVVGLGPADDLDRETAFCAAGAAARHLAGKQRQRIAFFFSADWPAELVESGVAGAVAGSVGQDLYRAKKNLHPPEEIFNVIQVNSL